MLSHVLPLAFVAVFQVQVKASVERRAMDSTKAAAAARAKNDTTRKYERDVNFGISIGGGSDDDEDRPPVKRIPVTDEMRRTAFKDPVARDLLLRARKARLQQDSMLVSYDARTYQRFSVGMGLRAFGRDRLLMRHEDVTQVKWHKKTGAWVSVKGSRTALPVAKDDEASENVDMANDPPIPYYPGREELWIGSGLAKAEVNERELVHPIAEGSEAYYTYETGDSVIMVLPDQSRITLREIKVEARQPKWNLAVGSFWFDQSTAHLVRAVYRLSVPIDIWAMDETKDDMKDVPIWVKPMLTPMRASVDAISLEYGLYNQRFWMPKLQVLEASAQVSLMRVPVQMEQRFSYSSVNGLDSLPKIPAAPMRMAAFRDSLKKAGVDSVVRDSLVRQYRKTRDASVKDQRAQQCATGDTYTRMQTRYNGTLNLAVQLPCDSTKLATSKEFTGSLYEPGESVFGTGDIDDLKKALSFGLQAGWVPQKPVVEWGLPYTRFNRVEGLSSGLETKVTLGRGYTAIAGARGSLSDKQLNGHLALERTNGRSTFRGTVFRRLSVASDFGSPLSFGAGLAALLYAGDEGFYYRSWGGELSGVTPHLGRTEWRLFAEQQWNAPVATHFTLLRGAHDDRVLPNVVADKATEYGAAVRVQKGWGLDPKGFRTNADIRAEGAAGDFDYGRGLLDLTVSHGMPFGTQMAITGSAGGTAGTAPAQRAFQLGGLQSVRGITPGTMSGNAFWMGRGELALNRSAVKPVLFGDVGWAGDRKDFSKPGRPMSGVGVGASILDGMIRFDVARGLYPTRAVRVDLSLEARF
ncbi:MAG: ShlB/FhaC/HecB family hemolysin secretion/activation protein [Gemmatimonadaceae bacterium]